jgi:hypothetical protein
MQPKKAPLTSFTTNADASFGLATSSPGAVRTGFCPRTIENARYAAALTV